MDGHITLSGIKSTSSKIYRSTATVSIFDIIAKISNQSLAILAFAAIYKVHQFIIEHTRMFYHAFSQS
jgi:hypothetical protein